MRRNEHPVKRITVNLDLSLYAWLKGKERLGFTQAGFVRAVLTERRTHEREGILAMSAQERGIHEFRR